MGSTNGYGGLSMGLCDFCKSNQHERHTSHYPAKAGKGKTVSRACDCYCTKQGRELAVGDNRTPYWKPTITKGEDRVRELRQRQGRRPLTPGQKLLREKRLKLGKQWREVNR